MSLFRRDQGTGGVEDDLASHLLAQDLIYVGGGNVVSMLGAWRAHGLDDDPAQGVAQGRSSCAGPRPDRCAGSTRRSARSMARRAACAGSACCRTPTASTTTPSPPGARSTTASSATACAPGFAVEDGVALHFRATRLRRAVSSRPDGRAYRVKPAGDGVVETAPSTSLYLRRATRARRETPRDAHPRGRGPSPPEPLAA